MSKWPFLLALAASLAAAADARPAVTPRAGEGQAEELFDKGRRLLLSGHYEQACPVFDESYRLLATLGTLLNRADCYEHTGRLADAWRLFDQAASWAARTQAGKRREVAFTRALALAARLPWIEVKAEAGARVSVDGALLGREGEGRRIPVDPGSHTLVVEGPGAESWTRAIDVPSTPGVIAVAPPLVPGDKS